MGTSEIIPLNRMISRLDGLVPGLGQRMFLKMLNETKGETIEEILQEGFQSGAGDVIAKNIVAYDPDRKLFDSLREDAAVGGVTGFLFSLLTQVVGKHSARVRDDAEKGKGQPPPPAPDKPATETTELQGVPGLTAGGGDDEGPPGVKIASQTPGVKPGGVKAGEAATTETTGVLGTIYQIDREGLRNLASRELDGQEVAAEKAKLDRDQQSAYARIFVEEVERRRIAAATKEAPGAAAAAETKEAEKAAVPTPSREAAAAEGAVVPPAAEKAPAVVKEEELADPTIKTFIRQTYGIDVKTKAEADKVLAARKAEEESEAAAKAAIKEGAPSAISEPGAVGVGIPKQEAVGKGVGKEVPAKKAAPEVGEEEAKKVKALTDQLDKAEADLRAQVDQLRDTATLLAGTIEGDPAAQAERTALLKQITDKLLTVEGRIDEISAQKKKILAGEPAPKAAPPALTAAPAPDKVTVPAEGPPLSPEEEAERRRENNRREIVGKVESFKQGYDPKRNREYLQDDITRVTSEEAELTGKLAILHARIRAIEDAVTDPDKEQARRNELKELGKQHQEIYDDLELARTRKERFTEALKGFTEGNEGPDRAITPEAVDYSAGSLSKRTPEVDTAATTTDELVAAEESDEGEGGAAELINQEFSRTRDEIDRGTRRGAGDSRCTGHRQERWHPR